MEQNTSGNEVTRIKKAPVVNSASSKVKKQTGLSKIVKAFVPEDPKGTGENVWKYIIVPKLKGIALDIFKAFLGIDGTSSSSGVGRQQTPYRSAFQSSRSNVTNISNYTTLNNTPRPSTETESWTFDTYEDAKLVLENMVGDLQQYGLVSVADYYDYMGKTHYFTDEKYGWKNLSMVRVEPVVVDGDVRYRLTLPQARPLD